MVAFARRSDKTGNGGRKIVLLLAVLIAAAGIWHASLRVPTGPDEGFALDGLPLESPPARQSLRVATFSIHSGKGRDGHYDLDRVAACLEGLDLVALNEVRGWSYRRPANQAEILGRQLQMGWLFAPAEQRCYCRQFGNGLLCRYPVDYWQRIPLACRDGRSHRNIVLAAIPHRGQTVRVLMTHLTRRTDEARAHQLRTVAELFLSLQEPAILLGDLNSVSTDPQMEAILTSPGVVDPLQEAGVEVSYRIDWILARGFRTVDAGFRDDGASDHPMIWAELELREREEE
jgi:endonuclease/exonuclease/phosphatase family metal-dependent hydrolase